MAYIIDCKSTDDLVRLNGSYFMANRVEFGNVGRSAAAQIPSQSFSGGSVFWFVQEVCVFSPEFFSQFQTCMASNIYSGTAKWT